MHWLWCDVTAVRAKNKRLLSLRSLDETEGNYDVQKDGSFIEEALEKVPRWVTCGACGNFDIHTARTCPYRETDEIADELVPDELAPPPLKRAKTARV